MSEKEQNDGEKKVTLSEAALWFRIEDLKNESRELNRAIADISQLVSYTQVDSMVDADNIITAMRPLNSASGQTRPTRSRG